MSTTAVGHCDQCAAVVNQPLADLSRLQRAPTSSHAAPSSCREHRDRISCRESAPGLLGTG